MTARRPQHLKLLLSPAIIAAMAALVCSLFFHGEELFNFVLSIDEEFGIGHFSRANHIENGRWGTALLGWLILPQHGFPVTALGIFLVAYGIAFVLIIRRLGVERWESILLSAPLFFGFPVLLYLLVYNTCNFAIGIGLLVSAIILYIQPRLKNIALAASMVAFAVATYQSVLFFIMLLFIADYSRGITKLPREDLKALAWWYPLVTVCGLIVYGVVSLVILLLFRTTPVYLQHFFIPEQLAVKPLAVFKATIANMWELYSGAASCFLNLAFYYRILSIVVVAMLIWQIIAMARSSARVGLVFAVCIIGIVLTPFLQYPTSGGSMPYRTLVALPLAVSVLAFTAADGAPHWLRRWILVPLAVLVSIEFSAINNIQYYAGQWALERDKTMAMQIVFQIRQILPKQKVYTIALVGAGPPYNDSMVPSVGQSTIGASFFNWDQGSVTRVAAFLGIVSGFKFRVPTDDQSMKAMNLAAEMPSWPLPDSIAVLDDFVIIKLSDPTDSQIKDLCRESTSGFCTIR